MHSSAYGYPTCHGSTKALSNVWPLGILFFSKLFFSSCPQTSGFWVRYLGLRVSRGGVTAEKVGWDMGPVFWHHFPACLGGSFLHPTPAMSSTHAVLFSPASCDSMAFCGWLFQQCLASSMAALIIPGEIMAPTRLWQLLLTLGESGFSLVGFGFGGGSKAAPHSVRNIFSSCHVCSVLQMDCISMSWWLFTASCILKLWLPVILRRKWHCNWLTMTVLALKIKSLQILLFGFLFFNRSTLFSFTLRPWLHLAKRAVFMFYCLD